MPESSTAKPNPDEIGFGVYIHWPFCAAKCPYCDFNSHVRQGGVDQQRFVAGYLREIARIRSLSGPRRVTSIFFGGGTPSLMEPATVGGLLDAVAQHWSLADDVEVTLEANPTSVEADRFRAYRDLGVNRVSLGVQSLQDPDLRSLGRLHTADEALRALDTATTNFARVSFDLIYARPGQSVADWTSELQRALEFAPGHLSLYQLTIEDGTPFATLHQKGKLRIPAPEQAEDLFGTTQDLTAAAGLRAYEISNHARPGEESRHNLLYWRYGEYAGIGPGAHGRLIVDGKRIATSSERLPERWLEHVIESGDAFVEFEPLATREQADELLLMGLRLTEGVDLSRLARIGGMRLDEDRVAEFIAEGLLWRDATGDRLVATDQGRFVLNRLVLELSSGMPHS